ncbi:MAG TPA: hypothetical protein VGJ20_25800 [Xanthobacteraceae bacterium]|jgi:hypothetical protein
MGSTRLRGALAVVTFAAIPIVAADAQNESQSQTQSPPSLANAYRGMFVCEQQRGSADVLHVPFDIAVRGSEVQFARPLFNLRGTRVLGSELGDGSVDPNGKVHVTSTWEYRGITVRGDYSGTLTPSGGTLTGTQSWRGPGDEVRSRTCQVAVVPAANAQHAAAK